MNICKIQESFMTMRESKLESTHKSLCHLIDNLPMQLVEELYLKPIRATLENAADGWAFELYWLTVYKAEKHLAICESVLVKCPVDSSDFQTLKAGRDAASRELQIAEQNQAMGYKTYRSIHSANAKQFCRLLDDKGIGYDIIKLADVHFVCVLQDNVTDTFNLISYYEKVKQTHKAKVKAKARRAKVEIDVNTEDGVIHVDAPDNHRFEEGLHGRRMYTCDWDVWYQISQLIDSVEPCDCEECQHHAGN
jgi:hypothetical protein